MAVNRYLLGNERGRMPDLYYRIMAFFIRAREALFKYSKPTGVLILDDGHQPRWETKQKVASSVLWIIALEKDDPIKYVPIEMEI